MLLVAAAGALATIPVWMPAFPPMADLPQHAAQVVLLRNLLHPGFPFASMFHLHWLTPYLLGYLLVFALLPVVGIVAACKCVVALALGSMPPATALVMGETGADRRWALLVVPALYGFTYQWGFLNFLVAAPLGFVFLWLAYRHARAPRAGTAVALALSINALFFCHAMICAAFATMGGFILLLSGRNVPSAVRRALPLLTVLPLMLLWAHNTASHPLAHRPVDWDLGWIRTHETYYARTAEWTSGNGRPWGRITGFFPRLFGVHPGPLVPLVGLGIFGLPLLAGARPSRRVSAWIPFGTCIVILLLVPGVLFGTDFTFQRFTMFALPLYLLTLTRREQAPWPPWTWPACAIVAVAWIAGASFVTRAYDREAAGFPELTVRMEPGQRTISFVYDRDSPYTIAPTYLHFAVWASALRDGVVDPNFGVFHTPLVVYNEDQDLPMRLFGFEWSPWGYDWDYMRGREYRYFISHSADDMRWLMFQTATCPVRLVEHAGRWWLYEKDPACRPTAPARS